MATINTNAKISKRFLVVFGVTLLSMYTLSWAMYALDYAYAHGVVSRHYRHKINVQECVVGPGSGKLIDESRFSINYGVDSLTPITPIFITKGFVYGIDYEKDGQTWQAGGTVTFLGALHENYSRPYPPCLLQ